MKLWRNALLATTTLLAHTALAAEDAGIPQMDQTWYPNQLFWLAITFGALFLIVSRVIVPSVGGVIHARDVAIREAIAEAERAKQEAESTRGNFESAGHGARAKAAELLANAQAQNSREASEAFAKLDHDLARKTEQAQIRIEDAVKKAKSGLDAASDSLAEAMVEKLLSSDVQTSQAPAKRRAKA